MPILILLVIAVLWALYLVPLWLRSRGGSGRASVRMSGVRGASAAAIFPRSSSPAFARSGLAVPSRPGAPRTATEARRRRREVLLGLGGAAVFTLLLGLLVGATWLVTGIVAGLWMSGILLAVVSLLVFFALLLAVSVCAGVITRSAPAAMLATVAFWAFLFVMGIMHAQAAASRVREGLVGRPRPVTVADALRGRTQPRKPVEAEARPFHRTRVGRAIEAVYTVLPHTSDLDAMVDRQLMRGFAVGGRLRRLLESGEFSWRAGVGLTLAHAAVFLAIACAVFARRDP